MSEPSSAKRAFDLAVTLVAAPFGALIAAPFAVSLAVELRGSPWFVQERVGRGGRPFRMYKLRTMRSAEPDGEVDHRVRDWSAELFNPANRDDPRIGRVGRIARTASVDEIPNLLNVLAGAMSLVGPRPEIPEIVAQYPERFHRRHDVLPGIAGLAQMRGRSDLTYEETLTYDLEYVDSHSVLIDVHILVRSFLAALRGRGAR